MSRHAFDDEVFVHILESSRMANLFKHCLEQFAKVSVARSNTQTICKERGRQSTFNCTLYVPAYCISHINISLFIMYVAFGSVALALASGLRLLM